MDVEVRLEGEGISPQTISSRQFAKLIEHFEVALEALIMHDAPALGLKEGELVLAVQEVSTGSLRVVFHTGYDQDVAQALSRLGQALTTAAFDVLPLRVVDALAEIQSVTRRYRAVMEIASVNGERRVWGRLHADMALRTRRTLSTTETLYGRVIRVGGEKPPRAKLIFWDGSELTCEITKRDQRRVARQLAARLYDWVGVQGEAQRSATTWELLSFSVQQVLPYVEKLPADAFQALAQITTPAIEAMGGLEAYQQRIAALEEDDL